MELLWWVLREDPGEGRRERDDSDSVLRQHLVSLPMQQEGVGEQFWYQASDLVWTGGQEGQWECGVGNVTRINVAVATEEGFLHLEQQ